MENNWFIAAMLEHEANKPTMWDHFSKMDPRDACDELTARYGWETASRLTSAMSFFKCPYRSSNQ